MQLPVSDVAAVLGASGAVPEGIATGYSIDSRTLQRGAVFFAIRGSHFDGHQFVEDAFERGAVCAVVEHAFREQAPAALAPALISVRETTRALQQLAQAVRRKWGRRLIAVTGSAGKTTTKELIAALLGTRFSVHKSPGNLNNQYGVPLALLALEPTHDVAVIELAMSAPGEIARLAQIAEPEIGVVTNVAPAHLQFFDSLDSIARAKRELVESLKSPATAVLNYDDPRVRRFGEGFNGRVLTFGFEEGAEFRALEFRARNDTTGSEFGTAFRVSGPTYEGELYLPLPGRHNVENALAAIATVSLFDTSTQDLWRPLYSFKALPQRAEVLRLPNHALIINDCYNSNPRAMVNMLEALAAWPDRARRIVLAGEMLELGPSSSQLHREIGRKCAKSRVDWLLAVQGDARFLLEGAIEGGLPPERGRFFPDANQAGEFCLAVMQPEDVILVKGSRGVHLEKVIGLLQRSVSAVCNRPSGASADL